MLSHIHKKAVRSSFSSFQEKHYPQKEVACLFVCLFVGSGVVVLVVVLVVVVVGGGGDAGGGAATNVIASNRG